MGSYRQFWGCEVPGGAGKEVSVEDGDRLNVCQVRPQRCPMHPPASAYTGRVNAPCCTS
jgi:hypothetical protein